MMQTVGLLEQLKSPDIYILLSRMTMNLSCLPVMK